MRVNGTLYVEHRQPGGLNEHGEPIGDSAHWSFRPVDCLIEAVADNRLGKYEDGEFRQASYSVLVEASEFHAARIRLICRGEELGEFRPISITPLSLGRVKILV